MSEIKKAAVLGAGVMGSAIAAHLANAGVSVMLMDIVPKGAKNRNAIAVGALEKLLRTEPPAFMHKKAANLITPANIEDHLDLLSGVDWIIEAIVEDLKTKRDLYQRIEKLRKDGSVVSSNTSTLPLAKLVEGLPERFARDFLITHFFNPPRYIRLLELVAGPGTRPEAVQAIREFADRRLGKTVVLSHDTPGFIANRIGAFWLQSAVAEAVDHGLSIEEVDAIMGRSLGVPKTGVFGLLDLIGLDVMMKVDASLEESLPVNDSYRRIRRDLPLLSRMIEHGYTGRKGKGGFYRLRANGGNGGKEAIDLTSGEYRPTTKPALESLDVGRAAGFRALVEHPDKGGSYAWAVLSQTLAYAAQLVPEIADDVHTVDRTMQLGYNWIHGPFELIDRLGAGYLAKRLKHDGKEVPALLDKAASAGGFYRVQDGRPQQLTVGGSGYFDVPHEDGLLLLSSIKREKKPLSENSSASLWDVGDGVVCLEVHTKMNTIDPGVFAMIRKALGIVQSGYQALVIYNEGQHFSAGVNLGLALFAANVAAWPMIEELLTQGQEIYQALKYSNFPVVGASSGLALGGGCELLLHCDAVQAHVESYIGLVETAVGLVPAWGGCKELLARLSADPHRPRGPMPPVTAAFEMIGLAKVSKSAFEAKGLGFLRPTDSITFNRDRLLADAKAKALELAAGYRPPERIKLTLPGPAGKAALGLALRDLSAKGKVTVHDEVVAGTLAEVITGGVRADPTEPVSEDEVLRLERSAFMLLVKSEATLARMEHMLETGKPLRN
ncbi:3-hydroxyacyl-CoA dehydrogenase/enoyl-CoA hydratase family protein [bacterium]|nr:MAG: 3-hydroxyacyl-CoA dehydrogenase/enoyl-CoA hydratase family protein [bacterium]